MRGDLNGEHTTVPELAFAPGENDSDGGLEIARVIPCPHCGESLDPTHDDCPKCGGTLTIVQRFRIDTFLGQGGMGVVYGAVDQVMGGRVAVKVQKLEGDWKNHELFERSSRILTGLNYPGIPSVVAFEKDEHGRGFLIREDFQGGTLEKRILEQRHHLDSAQIKTLLTTLLQTLEYLHTRQPPVLHRDIKASNIMFRSVNDWVPILVDFDTLAAPKGQSDGLTIVGTPGYTAPEQLMGSAEPASDLFSLGATILFVATHRSPDELPRGRGGRFDVDSLLPSLEEGLRETLSKLSEPSLEQRFESAREALEHLWRPKPKTVVVPRADYNQPNRAPSVAPPKYEMNDFIDEEFPNYSTGAGKSVFIVVVFLLGLVLMGMFLSEDDDNPVFQESSPGTLHVSSMVASFSQEFMERGLSVEIKLKADNASSGQLNLHVEVKCEAERGLSDFERSLRGIEMTRESKDQLPEGPATLVDSQSLSRRLLRTTYTQACVSG